MKKFLLFVLLAAGVFSAPANAQQQLQALIVSACGTPPVSYVAGTYGILTMDTTGKLCDGGSGGGGGGTVTQGPGGASAWLVTGTGGTFPVTGTVTANQGTANATPWNVALPTTPTVAAGNGVVETPSSEAAAGLTPVSSSSLEANHVIKASPGNLYSFNVSVDSTLSAVAWWLMIYNATAAPADGAVTPAKCYAFPAGTTSYSAAFPLPIGLGTGITMGVSTTGCLTKTASAHAFISGDAK